MEGWGGVEEQGEGGARALTRAASGRGSPSRGWAGGRRGLLPCMVGGRGCPPRAPNEPKPTTLRKCPTAIGPNQGSGGCTSQKAETLAFFALPSREVLEPGIPNRL